MPLLSPTERDSPASPTAAVPGTVAKVGTRLFLSPPHMGDSEFALVSEAFASNWIAPTGPMVSQFERDLAALTGIGHVAALSSGTAALHLALRLSEVGPGDAVWGPTMTFIGGVAPILYQGATPVFLDIEEDGFLLDLDLLEDELGHAAARDALPKVVISTDLYGHVVDGRRMRALADRFGFIWISDAAEAVGAYRDGVHAGKGADFAILSFNGNKIITTSGGGALASDDEMAIERARFLSTQARESAAHYEHETYGYNYRLSNICAAIGVGQLRVLAERVAARRQIFETYRARLGAQPGLTFSSEPENMRANRWLTTVLIDPEQAGFNHAQAQDALDWVGIESRPLWKPMHMQPLFADALCHGGETARGIFERGLCLPSGSAMREADVAEVCEILLGLGR